MTSRPSNEEVLETPQHDIRTFSGSGFYVSGQMETQNVDWLVDTGCSITIISSRVFFMVPEDDRPELEVSRNVLTSADGTKLKTLGETVVNITVGKKTFPHLSVIADISNDGLLGMDFLKKHSFSIDFKNNTLSCADSTIVADCRLGRNQVCRVSVAENTVIPAGTRTILPGRATKPLAHGSWLVEPLKQCPGGQQVMTASTIIQGRGHEVILEVMNPTSEDVCLYRNTSVGVVTRLPPDHVAARICTDGKMEKERKIPASFSSHLSPEMMQIFDSIDADLSSREKKKVEVLLKQHAEVFASRSQPFGRTDLVTHSISTEVTQPIKQPVRRPPFHLRDEAQKEVTKMLDQGVIEPSESPWASPVVLVRKKDGSLRYCIDYRRLNSVTIKDSYPLPRIDESLDSLSEAKYFSTLDLASGYWQIGLDEDAKKKSAFCTTSGLYQFKVMPFGLTNAPATFQRLMERVLAGLQWQICLVYIDDVIIFSKTFDEHLRHLSQVFRCLRQAGLKLKPKKCFLFQQKVKYLGHIVSQEGIATDPDKTRVVAEWPTPHDVTCVKGFLGLCSYYRRFVPDFATVAKPLTRLTEKNILFHWGEDEEKSFLKLKELLISPPVMAYPVASASFILDTDASNTGIGAVLSQKIDDEERVIAYASRALTKPERQYCVTRKELLAVVYFCKYFKHYLLGNKFLLRTDHASLRWLKSFKEPEGQVARWLEVLDMFDYDLQHRPGRLHGNADAMSRIPCGQCDQCHESPVTRRGRPILTEQDVRPIQTRSRTKKTQKSDQDATPTSNWFPDTSITKDAVRQAQMADPVTSMVMEWVNKGEKPKFEDIRTEGREAKFYYENFSSLRITEGILQRELDPPDAVIRQQICLPPCLHQEALSQCHSSLTAGHFGKNKTLSNVKKRFIWYGMHRSVEIWCRQCDTCAKYKKDGRTRRAPLKGQVTGVPMERVCLDIVGPFPESTSGNRYALVITDYFTKYVEIYPMVNQEASSVATVLVRDFFSRYGVPHFLHSDQGTQFESKLFTEICELLQIEKTRTTPFHPQSDGLAERNIKTLSRMIAMNVGSSQNEWDVNLPFLSMAYRATPQASTGLSPNYMMFGRELCMPIDLMIGAPPDATLSQLEYVKELQTRLTQAYQLARLNLKKSAERQRKYYNERAYGTAYDVGSAVWYASKLRKKGVCPKLQPKWRGPCLVTKKFNDCLVHIQISCKKSLTVHVDLLKPCHSSKFPGWFRRRRRQVLDSAECRDLRTNRL